MIRWDTVEVKTAVDLVTHFVLTVMLAGYFRWLTNGWAWPALAVTGGILIDADHFIDHFLFYGWRFNFADFFCHRYQSCGKCYIFFHSWEIVFMLWALSLVVSWLTPLASGMTLHLVTDNLYSHRQNPQYLFLWHRWRRGFAVEKDASN
ncbi:MAG: hypothetical protein ABIA77_01720 [Candidatus Omnitrophota bacterium]